MSPARFKDFVLEELKSLCGITVVIVVVVGQIVGSISSETLAYASVISVFIKLLSCEITTYFSLNYEIMKINLIHIHK